MKSLVLKFNTREAYERAIDELEEKWFSYLIHGEILSPKHFTFKNWEELREAVMYYALEDTKSEYITGYIVVEITDPWIR